MRPENTRLPVSRKRRRGPCAKICRQDSRTSTTPVMARAAGMDADDIFFLGPDRHHRGEVGPFESLVESLLGILWRGENLGDHGILGIWPGINTLDFGKHPAGLEFHHTVEVSERTDALEAGAAGQLDA